MAKRQREIGKMGSPVDFDEGRDAQDLQALLDTIAASSVRLPEPIAAESGASGDSDDLQALFDSVRAQAGGCADAPAQTIAARREAMSDLQGTEDLLQDFLAAADDRVMGG